jgi:hypothetical protein
MGKRENEDTGKAPGNGSPGRPGKTTGSFGIGMLLAIGAVWADYAPLAPGNSWIYQGEFDASTGLGAAAQGRERLTLEILDSSQGGDTAYFRIRMRDSVYERKARSTFSGALLPLPDTVLAQTRVLASVGERAILMPVARDSGFLLDTTAFKFSGRGFSAFGYLNALAYHADLPGSPVPLPGVDSGMTVLPVHLFSQEKVTTWDDWYLEGVGAFWEKTVAGETASCGAAIRRDLELREFNGREIRIGVEPPAGPLAKRAKVACSAIRIPARLKASSLQDWRANVVDLTGRSIPRSALTQWPRATAAWYTLSTPTTKAASR